MFDVGFSELLIIAVVALIVLGPERLPKAARFAGLWVRKARAQWYAVKSELEFELAQDEMKKHLHEVENSIKAPVLALQEDIQHVSAELEKSVNTEPGSESKPDEAVEEKIDVSSVENPERSDTEEYSLYDLNEKLLEQTDSQNLEHETDQQLLDPAQGKLW